MQSEEPVSLIQELRLRQWARRNYVPAEWRRDTDWHSIVLDEMRRRDAELQELEIQEAATAARVTPASLMPITARSSEFVARHEPTPVTATSLRRRIERGLPGVIPPFSPAGHSTRGRGITANYHGR